VGVFTPLLRSIAPGLAVWLFLLFSRFKHQNSSPRRLSGERPHLGDGVPKRALGGPPGGVPWAARSSGPYTMAPHLENRRWGGPGGAPGGPRGGLCGAQGASGGVRGPLPGGYPPGGPLVAALPTDTTARVEPPPGGGPRGGPPGGHFWGVRTRWGQNQAKSSLTVVYRGGRGGPPKSALGALPAGGPKKGPSVGLCGCFYRSFAVDRTMSVLVVLLTFLFP
jgi:hypothetical protein